MLRLGFSWKDSYCLEARNRTKYAEGTLHTVAIWTFTFHKISGFVRVILKANFKQPYRPVLWFLLSENSYIYYSHFPSIFCRSCQIHCFLHTVTAISKRLKCLSHIFASNCNLNMSSHWNSNNSVQKAVNLTTPAKNRRKMSIIKLNFQIKMFIILACTLAWNLSSKSPLQSLIFCEM